MGQPRPNSSLIQKPCGEKNPTIKDNIDHDNNNLLPKVVEFGHLKQGLGQVLVYGPDNISLDLFMGQIIPRPTFGSEKLNIQIGSPSIKPKSN